MAGSSAEDYDVGGSSSSFIEGMSNEERCPSVDSLAEWRSSEQVENGTPSTSPPYWDTDEDDDGGLKPSDLYGKHTWKIENFSQLNKREMRSNAFEVGGYKWYILIYPQGCDVSNHLSLFLCVSQHEKLLPGWGHFAQFTIAVVNKESKKSKYSDTLHRFWKKEHDWGWKKFIELSKVSDGFIVADTLIIKAQVQVIREKAHRPFRCLDRNYRRELVRIYLSNVEQICRRFVEEKRSKLNKLKEDKMRWSSFRAFWLGVDQISRRRMSREKTDSILKVVVKQFFVDKEVTSTLVMDSLYSGLKALEWQSKNREDKERPVDAEELPAPMVYVEKDMFVLADDVLLLLGRLAQDPLPLQPSPPKDDKGYQNRTKDESSGEELNKEKDFCMRDERCLTELGRRTVEIFVLGHIFSNNIETAYKEAVALKRQEELIREEEAAVQVESDLKAKRNAAEKEKRAKKKQAKQKRNTRKVKDVARVEKSHVIMPDKKEIESQADVALLEEFPPRPTTLVPEKTEKMNDASNMSDRDEIPEVLQPELDDKNGSSVNWDTDASEVHPAIEVRDSGKLVQTEFRSHSMVDDTCSTCSTDSVPSVATNGPDNGSMAANSLPYNQVLPVRGKNQQSGDNHEHNGFIRGGKEPSSDFSIVADRLCDENDSCKDSQPEPVVILTSKDRIESVEQHPVKKEVLPLQKSLNSRDQVEFQKPNKSRTSESSSSPASSVKRPQFDAQPAKQFLEYNVAAATTPEIGSVKEFPSINHAQVEKVSPPVTRSLQVSSTSKSEIPKLHTPSRSPAHQVSLTPSPKPTPIVSTTQTSPLLSRSVSAAGRLGTEPSPSAPSYVPLSYRNATSGKTTMVSPASFGPVASTSSSQAVSYSQPPSAFLSSTASMFPPQASVRNGANPPKPGFTFGSVKPETLHNAHSWKDERYSHQEASTSGTLNGSNLASEINATPRRHSWKDERYPPEASSSASSSQAQGTLSEEFPHLGIINDLLDDDPHLYKAANGHHHSFNRQYTFPRDAATASNLSLGDNSMFDPNEQYYGEGFQRVYGSSNGHLHGLGDAHHRQMELLYGNGQIDMVSQTQWPYQHADPRMVNMGSVDVNGYPYQFQDYSNSTSAENGGYSIYRPSNGI